MKTLYLIGGTMGVGKSTVCQLLKKRTPYSVTLDGDWCWDMNARILTCEVKAMVLDNISHLLNNFLACPMLDRVFFCWVMHEQSIIDDILFSLNTENVRVVSVSLVCTEEALKQRLKKDIDAGLRLPDITERSIQRLPLYKKLNTILLDATNLTPEETAEAILKL